jgi:hypothetical protein
MSKKKLNLARVYAEVEDYLVPTLRLDPYERALYYHLLRHTRLAGKRKLYASRRALANSSGFGQTTIRRRLPGLTRKGCVRVSEWRLRGKVIEVLLPREIPANPRPAQTRKVKSSTADIYTLHPQVRRRILRRENGLCFYCRSRLRPETTTIDHVIPLARGGARSEHNLVACCCECNIKKHRESAGNFFASLRAQGLITGREYIGRLAALEALQSVIIAKRRVPGNR